MLLLVEKSWIHKFFFLIRNESEPLSIRAGQFDTMMTQSELPYQERYVREVLIHPRFKSNNLRNNFALLILEQPIEIDDHVDIACLVDHSEDFVENKCMTIGWDKFCETFF